MPLRRWLAVIWLCFIVRGIFYCTVWPLWEGFDEWAHFAVAQEMSLGHPLIDRNSTIPKDINISLQLAPLPRGMTFEVPQGATRETFWQLPVEERARRYAALRMLSAQGTDEQVVGIPAYEASQPPLYYWLIAIVLHALRNLTLLDRVWFVRVTSFAIASLSIPIGFILSRRIFRNESFALGLTSLVVLMPGLAINLARVSNESLGIVIYTCLLLAICRWIEQPLRYSRTLGVGISLGLGLLTKAYFLTAVPALMFLSLWLIWRHRKLAGRAKEYAVHAAVVFAVALGIGGWWYLRNYLQTGTLSGLDEALMVRNIGFAEKVRAAIHVDWYAAFDTILLSHIWYAGWSLFALRRSIYRIFFDFLFLASCGQVISRQFLKSSSLFSISVLYGFFWIGQGFQIVMLFLSKSSSTAMGGWYLYSMFWAEVILFIVGIFAIVPMRFRKPLLLTFITAIAGLDIYSLHFVSIPYYAHTKHVLSSDVFQLLADKPNFLSPSVLVFLWGSFLLTTVLAVFAGFNGLYGMYATGEFAVPRDDLPMKQSR